MKFLFFLLIPIFSSATQNTVEKSEFKAAGLKEFSIRNATGNIEIKVGANDKVLISADKITNDPKCEIEMEKSDDELEVSIDKSIGKEVCKVNFVVTLPKAMDVEVKNGSGQVKINGIRGEVDVAVGAGNTEVDGEILEIEAKAGSGNIVAKGIIGEAEFKLGSGNLDITYNQIMNEGELDIKTGSGDALVRLMDGQKLKTSYWSPSGDLKNELGENDDAKFEVSMKSGSGSLKILKK